MTKLTEIKVDRICNSNLNNEEKIKQLIGLIKEAKEELIIPTASGGKIFFHPTKQNKKYFIDIYVQKPEQEKKIFAKQIFNINGKNNFWTDDVLITGIKLGELKEEHKEHEERLNEELKKVKHGKKAEKERIYALIEANRNEYREKRNILLKDINSISSKEMIKKLSVFQIGEKYNPTFLYFVHRLEQKLESNQSIQFFYGHKQIGLIFFKSDQAYIKLFINNNETFAIKDNKINKQYLYEALKAANINKFERISIFSYDAHDLLESYVNTVLESNRSKNKYLHLMGGDLKIVCNHISENVENAYDECKFLNKSIEIPLLKEVTINDKKYKKVIITKSSKCFLKPNNGEINDMIELKGPDIVDLFKTNVNDISSVHFIIDEHRRIKESVEIKMREDGFKEIPKLSDLPDMWGPLSTFIDSIYIRK